jgi:hypothetical protein
MKIRGIFQNLEMCGAIKKTIDHYKWDNLGRRASIDACLRVWKHKMRCNNENRFGNFLLFYPASVWQMTMIRTES